MSSSSFLRAAKDFIKRQQGEVAPFPLSEEEINPDVQYDQSLSAFSLESTEQTYPVGFEFPDDSSESEFVFFEDGRQRTVQIGHIPVNYGDSLVLIPVHFFVVAAVILERRDRNLRVWRTPRVRQGICVPRSLIPEQEIMTRFEAEGLTVVDSQAQGIGTGDYYGMRRGALTEVKRQRLMVEQDLISAWRSSPAAVNDFLVVDGTLMNLRDEAAIDRCIGVSKSFGTRYFDVSTHNRIMGMPDFHRSWVFQFHDPEETADDLRHGVRERLSWYLRLRSQARRDPEFGLVRLEISKTYSPEAGPMADRFSRSLLAERLPTAYPTPRWDKHLYVVKACEDYLNSVMPSVRTINASMSA